MGMLYCRPMLKTLLEKSQDPILIAPAPIAFCHFGGKD
jgi:hypothetical protein